MKDVVQFVRDRTSVNIIVAAEAEQELVTLQIQVLLELRGELISCLVAPVY